MFSKLCWNAEYAWEECRRRLSMMGLKPSFPVVVEPILYEPQQHFTSTGRRRVVNNRKMVVKYELTEFQKINNQIYQDVVTQRRMTHIPKRKINRVDFKKLHQKYPNWRSENFAEFRIEFKESDLDDDGLLNFEEYCATLTRLGDENPLEIRYSLFHQHVTMDFPEHIDFEDFVDVCNTLSTITQQHQNCSENVQFIQIAGKSSSSSDENVSEDSHRSGSKAKKHKHDKHTRTS